MSLSKRNITVIGAGVSGLSVARALALRGASVTVLEQADAIREVGAGLQIGPNGMAVLRGLGLDPALRDTGALVADALCLHDRTGARLARFPMAGLARPDDYMLVHRADLIEVLAQGARDAGVTIRLDAQVVSVTPGPQPQITLADDTLHPDLIIGADGLHSITAKALGRDATPFFTGQIAWRAVVPSAPGDATDEVSLYMAPGRHIVTYPLRGGSWRNIVAVQERRDWTEESWSRQDDPANLRAAFADLGQGPRALLDRVETAHIWGLFRHPVADHWYGENVALMGDAVHPTLPFLAQGASMGLEDAWVLAAALDAAGDTQEAFARYQSLRHARAKRIVDAATRNAWAYHLKGPLAFGAHIGMRVLGRVVPDQPIRAFGWLYDHDVTGGVPLV